MKLTCKYVVDRVSQYYQMEGLTVSKRAIGYGLDGYEFANTIDDGDIRLFVGAAQKFIPDAIFIIGNAWGFSAFCLATIFPKARIDVIDAECEGDDVGFGSMVTKKIADRFCLKVNLSRLESPDEVVMAAGSTKYDIGLVDGKHGDLALVEDVLAIVPHMKHRNMLFMPCVTYKSMERGVSVV